MLTLDEIEALSQKPALSPYEQGLVFYTATKLHEMNQAQADLLAQTLDELDRLRSRLQFYRTTTTKLV